VGGGGGFSDAKMQHTGCRKYVGCKMQDAEHRIQDIDCRQFVDCRNDDAGCDILDVCTNAHEVHWSYAE
jgi:hypothetical protein